MSRKLIVEIVGDASSLQRSFKQASGDSRTFKREIEGSLRGVLSVSGAFEHLGRTIAFASGGFVAAASIGDFLRDSVDAAREAEVAQGRLNAQLKANREEAGRYRGRINEATLALGKFGFENDQGTEALTILDRGTRNIGKSLGLLGVTTDLARAKNLDLAAAAGIVAKVFGGQETALRRAVPGLSQNAHGMNLVERAAAKLSGQAAASTTQSEKFNAILHDTKEIIGVGILPTLDRYLERLGEWLDKANRSGSLQQKVNTTVRDGEEALQGIGAILGQVSDDFHAFGDVVGGTKNEVELLAGAFLLLKTRAKLIEWGVLSAGVQRYGAATVEAAVAEKKLAEQSALVGRVNAYTGVGAIIPQAERATLEVSKLSRALGLLRAGGEVAIVASLVPRSGQGKNALESSPLAFLEKVPLVRNIAEQGARLGQDAGNKVTDALTTTFDEKLREQMKQGEEFRSTLIAEGLLPQRDIFLKLQQGEQAIIKTFKGFFSQLAAAGGKAAKPFTPLQQLTLGLLQSPNDLDLLRQQVEHDNKAIAFAQKRRGQGKLTNKQFLATVKGYYEDRSSTLSQIASIVKANKNKGITAEDRNTFFDNRLARLLDQAQDGSITDQIQKLKTIGKLITDRLAATKDVTRRLTLQQDLLDDVTRPLAALRQQQAADILDSLNLGVTRAQLTTSQQDDLSALNTLIGGIKKQIAATGETTDLENQLLGAIQQRQAVLKQIRDNAITARNASQFKTIGLTAAGEDIVPGVASLRRQLGTFEKAVDGTFLDTNKVEARVAQLKKVLSGALGEVGSTVREKIKGIIDDWNQQLKDAGGDQTLFTHVGKAAILNGLGLSPQQRRALNERIAVVGPNGTVPAKPSGQFTGGSGDVVITGPVYVQGVDDVKKLSNQLVKHAKRRANVTRGRVQEP